MIFRVSSMYQHNRHIVWALGCAFILEIMSVVVIVSLGLRYRKGKQYTRPSVCHPRVTDTKAWKFNIIRLSATPGFLSPLSTHQCSTKHFPRWILFTWTPIAVFEALIVFLSLKVAIQYYRSVKAANSPMSPNRSTRLAHILFRDSISFPLL